MKNELGAGDSAGATSQTDFNISEDNKKSLPSKNLGSESDMSSTNSESRIRNNSEFLPVPVSSALPTPSGILKGYYPDLRYMLDKYSFNMPGVQYSEVVKSDGPFADIGR